MANNSPETSNGEPGYLIGSRLRTARRAKRLKLKDVAERVECSESLLSKIENDKANPSLHMLHKICKALGMTIQSFFSPPTDATKIVWRKGERQLLDIRTLRDGQNIKLETLVENIENAILYGAIHIVTPGGSTNGTIKHEGEEVGYVLQGELELQVNGQFFNLNEGDSFYFRSDLPHGYKNPGSIETRVIWINTPPTF